MRQTKLPGYEIVGQLGEGGMGIVYRALEQSSGGEVAVKLLPRRLAGDAVAQGLFLRESILTSTLRHPNIARLVGSGQAEDGRYFFASELLRGRSLLEALRRELPTLDRALDIAAQAAAGLAVAHERRIVHRDIKPSNLMLVEEGRVKILDFGLACFDAARSESLGGRALGTVHYCSPEQIQGEDVDGRSDLWSLGVVLFEMVAGEVPFAGGDPRATLDAVLESDPVPVTVHRPDAPERLGEILSRALAKRRRDRFASARELEVELANLRDSLPPAESSRERPTEQTSEDGPVVETPNAGRGLVDRLRRWWEQGS